MLRTIATFNHNLNQLSEETIPALKKRIQKVKHLEKQYNDTESILSHETCAPRPAEVEYLARCRTDLQEAKAELDGLKHEIARRDSDILRLGSVVECAIERLAAVCEDSRLTEDKVAYLTDLSKSMKVCSISV
jgi:predicted transcriptional regulator